ncbi:MBL fold metallo-hydrolase [Exiguobacterium aurantiacum]|uniref:MBL fold metallo-hydrolase n=1 Tax=Exiguobacterium aurantiacum TaxID=33987 RepID=UPI001E62B05A|nr:MBL fold metallo-hydrolase [Exiguobacterium aurantiacum]
MKKSTSTNRILPVTSTKSGTTQLVADHVYGYTNQIVNAYFIQTSADLNEWVLVDAGMPASGVKLLHVAEQLFGRDHHLKAILLTHGHFDHVGGIVSILERFPVPVYAHSLEIPFLTGEKDYPEPDSSVEGGALAKVSSVYPVEAIDISEHLHPLPEGGAIPFLPEWEWMHTPGHSPGHVSYYRKHDKLLLAGDAFVTVKQDSLYRVLTQVKSVEGPPVYLTTDWEAAAKSVKKLAALYPQIAATGHGQRMAGEALTNGLIELADQFQERAVPSHGRYVDE